MEIARENLLRPEDFSGLQVQRDDGVARFRRWLGVVVARRDVNHPAFRIDRRGGPDSRARWTKLRRALLVRTGSFRRIDHVCFPDDRAVANAKLAQTPAKRAALIFWIARARFFPRRCWNEHDAVAHDRGTREPRRFVLVDPAFPDQPPRFGIERVKRSDLIGKQDCVTLATRSDDGCGAHWAVRLKRPVKAAGFRVHRVDNSAGATNEKDAVVNRWRGVRRNVSGKSKRPFQLQIANLLDRERCTSGGLKPIV